MTLENWLAFCSIAFIAAAVPGQAILLVTTHCLQYGFTRALLTVAGNVTGLFIMSGCSVLGLSALVLISSEAFTLVKMIGALYLLYMGVKLWRHGVSLVTDATQQQQTFNPWQLYRQGVLISLTNPKAIIFTSALFPQFVDVEVALMPQFLLLVITLMACSVICLSVYSLLSQWLKHRANASKTNNKSLGRLFGSSFIGAGVLLAFVTHSK